jgi:hypothetical protein
MLSGKKFIELVRGNRPDMDERLAEIFNQNIENAQRRMFDKAWYLIGRQKQFARKNFCQFWDEFNIIKEKLSKNGYSGEYLEQEAMKEYLNDKK